MRRTAYVLGLVSFAFAVSVAASSTRRKPEAPRATAPKIDTVRIRDTLYVRALALPAVKVSSMPQRWQYAFVPIEGTDGGLNKLVAMGRVGWELVTPVAFNGRQLFILKSPMPTP